MKKFRIVLLGCMALVLSISGCKKAPGQGGLASIKGKVFARDYSSGGTFIGQGYIGDERVFLCYGEDTYASEDTRTSFTGEFVFNYLQTGKYSVYVFTRCDTCAFGQNYVLKKVEITKKKEVVILEDFEIKK